jgi:hypothetical protein
MDNIPVSTPAASLQLFTTENNHDHFPSRHFSSIASPESWNMRFSLLLVALVAAVLPVNTAATALRSEAIANSTIPSLNDLNETDGSIDGSWMDDFFDGSNMEAGKMDKIVNALSACRDMRSLMCWTEILNVFDSSYKHDTNKGGKINIQSIIKHIANIATIIKKLKGNR